MITFIVQQTDHVDETFECNTTETLMDLKKKIIEKYHLNCKYIDIISNVERPIRSLGKFNFDKGLLPITLDNYPFNRYDLDDRTIHIAFEENNEYVPIIKKNTANVEGTYIPPGQRDLSEKTFDINDEKDFPALG